jgi:hypothetical protein
METSTLTWSALAVVFISAIVSGLVSYFIHSKLIKHVYTVLKNLDTSKTENEKRQKAQIVAELLALWMERGDPDEVRRKKLNELSFQCALWLPSNILKDLNDRLVNREDAKHVKEILAGVRVHLGNDPIEAGIIVHFQ